MESHRLFWVRACPASWPGSFLVTSAGTPERGVHWNEGDLDIMTGIPCCLTVPFRAPPAVTSR